MAAPPRPIRGAETARDFSLALPDEVRAVGIATVPSLIIYRGLIKWWSRGDSNPLTRRILLFEGEPCSPSTPASLAAPPRPIRGAKTARDFSLALPDEVRAVVIAIVPSLIIYRGID